MRLRVLVLTPGFPVHERPPHRPAIIDTLATLAEAVDLEVHALRPPPDAPGEHLYRGLRVIGYGAGTKAARFAQLARRVRRDARTRRVDAVWSMWVDRTGPAALLLAKLAGGAPVVLSIMGGELADLPEHGYGYAKDPGRRRTLRALLGRADRITVGSEALLAPLAALDPALLGRARVTPLGAPASVLAALADSRAPWAAAELRLLAIADLSPVKRPELAVHVLAELRRRGVPATLTIHGEHTVERAAHVARLAERLGVGAHLTLAGFTPPEHLFASFGRYHALLHTSAHESQGCALVEAALAGLPIATTDVGVARELSHLGAAIEVVAPASAPGLADAVLAVARAPKTPPPAIAARYDLAPAARAFQRVLEEVAR